ncbi:MAG TPA: substrate-binding domain-containing protein [Beijerinckiaceae bacterium]
MTVLRLLSGGAAQGLVTALAPQFEAETGCRVEGTFGAVGARAAELRAGAPADLLILTAALIKQLEREGYVVPGSAIDLGTVPTAVAVRAGDPAPSVADADALRAALLAADKIHFPDPQQATAGIHFAKVLENLDIREAVEANLKTYPNGATAMRALAASTGERPLGCTQATEILNTPGVALVGPLPPGCDLATTYTAAVCAKASSPGPAARFIACLAAYSAREPRRRAGFA